MSWLRWFKKIPSALEISKIRNFLRVDFVRPVVPVEDTLDVFFFLADPLSEVSVSEKKYLVLDYSKTLEPDLETKLGLEHLNRLTLIHPRDVHVRPL